MLPNFRAWHKANKEMEPVLLICFVNRYVDVLPERNLEGGNQESWSFDDVEIMMGTGWQDKNGSEIFDGDILKYPHGQTVMVYERTRLTENAGHGQNMEVLYIGFQINDYYGPIEEIEIIGNIHEHPHLLEKAQ